MNSQIQAKIRDISKTLSQKNTFSKYEFGIFYQYIRSLKSLIHERNQALEDLKTLVNTIEACEKKSSVKILPDNYLAIRHFTNGGTVSSQSHISQEATEFLRLYLQIKSAIMKNPLFDQVDIASVSSRFYDIQYMMGPDFPKEIPKDQKEVLKLYSTLAKRDPYYVGLNLIRTPDRKYLEGSLYDEDFRH
ncbi:MAG: hypothetical protein V1822_01570 [Candidatus Micrarchaeota archaeon]